MVKTSTKGGAGSLFVGNNPLKLQPGDKIQLKGEKYPRVITYISGMVERHNVYVTCGGSGPFPRGSQIEYELVSPKMVDVVQVKRAISHERHVRAGKRTMKKVMARRKQAEATIEQRVHELLEGIADEFMQTYFPKSA